MSEWIQALFVSIFGSKSWLATLIISMIPIVELRGAIPFGASTSFWKENALGLWESFGISLAGSSFIAILLTFLFFPIFRWLKKTKGFQKLAGLIEKKLTKNSQKINDRAQGKEDKHKLILKILGVFAFVAIPLPLTGVWTGTCVALFIGLNKPQTMISVLVGNAVAGLLMTLISFAFEGNTSIVLYGFLILVLLFIAIELIRWLIKKLKNKKLQTANAGAAAEGNITSTDLETEMVETSKPSVNKEVQKSEPTDSLKN